MPKDANDPLRRRVALLWKTAAEPSRGPRPTLSLDRIAEAGARIADAEGLEAVSMQRVARELGYSTMSLYRHVPGKEQLVEVMMDSCAGTPPAADADDDEADWRQEIETWVRALWDTYVRHPWMLRVPIGAPPIGPGQLAWFEAALRPLSRAGLREENLVSVVVFLLGAVRQFAAMSSDLAEARARGQVSATEAEADYEAALRDVVSAERFPMLAQLVHDGTFQPTGRPDSGMLDDLDFGVQRVLDGLESYLRRQEV
ncbi:TetR/AcrR family transcriptional regulator [Saccharomonospora azurea]